jgi:hypothetical protein
VATDWLSQIPKDKKNLRSALELMRDLFPDAYAKVNQGLIDRSLAKDDDQARDDLFKYVVGSKAIQDVLGVDEATAEKLILGKDEGGINFSDMKDEVAAAKPQGVLAGGQTIQVKGKDGTTRYYQVYQFPPGSDSWVSYQFNSEAQAEAALGKGFARTSFTEARFDQKALAQGQAEEVLGLGGSFQGLMDDITRDAATAAGIRDPSLIGKMLSDKEMQNIMAQAIAGDWTPEQVLAEQRRTKFWTETLYPGISAFYGKSTEPEKAWNNYVGNITPALVDLGYKKDTDGTFNSHIKKMLDAGIDDQVFLENAPIFAQAAQNKDFFEVLRARSVKELGKDLKFGDWFSLLKGEAAPDLQQVAEGAVVAYQAKQAGYGLDEKMLQRLIDERDLSEAEARNLFSDVNQAVLALGEPGLKRGALTRDDIVSAAAGIAPAGGMTADEVRLKVAKLARENALFDEEKINFYVGDTPAGTPTRPGLAPLAPEGA